MNGTPGGIVTLTANPAVDAYTVVDRLVPGDKLRCRDLRRDPGGGGINVARAIHKLGGEALAVYFSGGAMGDLLTRLLGEEDVEGVSVSIGAPTRESFTVYAEQSQEEYRFVMPGPRVTEPEWRHALELLGQVGSSPGFLVASGSLAPGLPVDFYGRVARLARELEARLVLDTSGEALQAALEDGVYLVKPNRRELENLVGRELTDFEAQEQACRELVDSGRAQFVALTLGSEGALLVWKEGSCRGAPPQVELVSDVGAGDSFLASLVLALSRGRSPQEALCRGVAAGTAALATPGTELCDRQLTEELGDSLCAAGCQS